MIEDWTVSQHILLANVQYKRKSRYFSDLFFIGIASSGITKHRFSKFSALQIQSHFSIVLLTIMPLMSYILVIWSDKKTDFIYHPKT